MTNNRYEIHNLFPTAVLKTIIDVKFTEEQIKLFNTPNRNVNTYNTFSENVFILEEKCMQNLKTIFEQSVDYYFKDVLCISDDVTPYITQSWLNWTEQNQAHHGHLHQNSIVSGVFYVQTEPTDSIAFIKSDKLTGPFELGIRESSAYNAARWTMQSTQMSLILFPSNLYHEVFLKTSNSTRISLSFNTFIKGELGSKKSLTYLKL
jgi:uncharacterized protein (TIGR02466 family)